LKYLILLNSYLQLLFSFLRPYSAAMLRTS